MCFLFCHKKKKFKKTYNAKRRRVKTVAWRLRVKTKTNKYRYTFSSMSRIYLLYKPNYHTVKGVKRITTFHVGIHHTDWNNNNINNDTYRAARLLLQWDNIVSYCNHCVNGLYNIIISHNNLMLRCNRVYSLSPFWPVKLYHLTRRYLLEKVRDPTIDVHRFLQKVVSTQYVIHFIILHEPIYIYVYTV